MFVDKNDFEAWMKRIMERFDRLENKIGKPDKSAPTLNGEKLMDIQDLCILLNVSKRTLQYYRTKGWLPYKKIDQKTYYSEADVQIFLKEHMKDLRKKSLQLTLSKEAHFPNRQENPLPEYQQ